MVLQERGGTRRLRENLVMGSDGLTLSLVLQRLQGDWFYLVLVSLQRGPGTGMKSTYSVYPSAPSSPVPLAQWTMDCEHSGLIQEN